MKKTSIAIGVLSALVIVLGVTSLSLFLKLNPGFFSFPPPDGAEASATEAIDTEAVAPEVEPVPQPYKEYEIGPDDDLYKIAIIWGVSMDALRKANPGVGDSPEPGTILKIPGFGNDANDPFAKPAAAEAAQAVKAAPFTALSAQFDEDGDKLVVDFGGHAGGLTAPSSGAVIVDPGVAGEVHFGIGDKGTVEVMADFAPGTVYTVTLGGGWKNGRGETLGKPARFTLRAPEVRPSLKMASRGTYYPLSRDKLQFPFSSRGVTNLSVTIRRAYDSNVLLFGVTDYYRHQGNDHAFAQFNVKMPGDISRSANRMLDIGSAVTNWVPGLYHVEVDSGETIRHGEDYWTWTERVKEGFVFALTDLAVQLSLEPGRNKHAYAFVTALGTGLPVEGAEVVAYTKSHQVAATGRTDARGIVVLELDPRYDYSNCDKIVGVSARAGEDFVYLGDDGYNYYGDSQLCWADVKSVEKILHPRALVFSEREICRPGEAFESAVFLRSAARDGVRALAGAPIELSLVDPAGNVVETRRLKTGRYGFARAEWRIPFGAAMGQWRVTCTSAEKELFSMPLLVAAYVPDRFTVAVEASKTEVVGLETPLEFSGKAEYYFGEPVDSGTYKLTVGAAAATPPRHWKGWVVGTRDFLSSKARAYSGTLAPGGVFKVGYPGLSANEVDAFFGPVSLWAQADVQEPGGRNVSASCSARFYPTAGFIGLREAKPSANDVAAAYELVALPAVAGGDLSPVAGGRIEVSLSREEWSRHLVGDSVVRVEWESEQVEMPALGCVLDVPAGADALSWTGRVEFAASKMPSGKYTLVAKLGDVVMTETEFWHWAGEVTERSASPAALTITSRAEKYRPGETAELKFRSLFNGTAFVVAGTAGIDSAFAQSVTQGENIVEVPIPPDVVASRYYAAVTLVAEQPAAERRLFAVARIKVDPSETRKLTVGLEIPEKARPGETVDFKVTLKDALGRPAAGLVRIGAIDEGVAALTGFRVPNPYAYFFGTDFGCPFECFDIFSCLYPELKLLPNGKFGGDAAVMATGSLKRNRDDSNAEQRETARLVLPPVDVPTNGFATVSVTLPEHTGALRVMAVAGNEMAAGSSEDSVMMRNRISAMPTLPRFAVGGDTFTYTATLFNHDAEAGKWIFKVALPEGCEAEGGVREVVREGELAPGGSAVVRFPVAIGRETDGVVKFAHEFVLGGERRTGETPLKVRPKNPAETRVEYFAAENGELSLPPLSEDWIGEARGEIRLLGSPAYGVAESLSWLAEYPYGCLEQTTAAAFPFVVADDLVKLGLMDAAGKTNAFAKIKVAYAEILQMYRGGGQFSMWPWEGSAWYYGSLFASHFIFEAEKTGAVTVAKTLREEMLAWLRRIAADASVPNASNRAWATYILAVAGDEHFANPARNIISLGRGNFNEYLAAAALMRGGFASEGVGAFAKAVEAHAWETDSDWDRVKNLGMALFVAAKTGTSDFAALLPIVTRLNGGLRPDGSGWGNTRDNAWAALGLAAFSARLGSGKAFGRITIGGETSDFEVSTSGATFARGKDDKVVVSAGGCVFGCAHTLGIPKEPLGKPGVVKISRTYVDGDGRTVAKVRKGDLVTAVITLSTPAKIENAVLADLVPGGFELEDVTLATRSAAGVFKPAHIVKPSGNSEIRDDRWLWFGRLEPLTEGKAYTLTYTLRAVVPGVYAVPAASVEDMYNPDVGGSFVRDATFEITGE